MAQRTVDPQVEAVTKVATGEYDREYHRKAFEKMGLDTVTWITTGIPEFDALTMIPRGRTTQIQGPYAVGKTTLALNMLRGLTKQKVLYIDTEASLNPEILLGLGLDSDKFTLYNESAFIEDIYEVIIEAVSKPKYDMIILDSLAACTFKTEAANGAADANIGQKARIVNKLMRIIPMELRKTKTALVIINQERELIGGYVPQKYTPGGMGVPYGASLMVALKTTKGARFPKTGPPYSGHEVTAEIIKSKVNAPWRKATFKIYYGQEEAH
jgi:RecA/RadA recombinase